MRENPRVIQFTNLSLTRHLLQDKTRTVIVIPSPHGEYKSGISYNDALAAGEIYAHLDKIRRVDVSSPELLGDDISGNLILIGGKKANTIANDLGTHCQHMRFHLEDGVIYDQAKQVVLTSDHVPGKKRTTANVEADYGLITYTANPFGKSTMILHIAGIKGFGTLAAVFAIVDSEPSREIEDLLGRLTSGRDSGPLKNRTVEILVKTLVNHGRARRDSVRVQSLTVSDGKTSRTWESEIYGHLRPVVPHKLSIIVTKDRSNAEIINARIDDQDLKYTKSADRMNAIYLLAKRAREDYLNQSKTEGWVGALELAERLWQIRLRNGVIEIADEIKREMAKAIERWARHLVKSGKAIFSDGINLDHDYINSEILVPDLDIKKKIVDLVHNINEDERSKGAAGFQLIESKPGLGYRISLHPALIFITERGDTGETSLVQENLR